MSAVTLERLRLACILLFVVLAIVVLGNYVGWWHLQGEPIKPEPTWQWLIRLLLVVSLYALILLFLAIVIIKDKLPEAHRRAQAERKAWKEQERKKAAAAAVALSQRRETARAKAVAIARADYPQHIDEEALAERGWRGEEDNFDVIGRHLDPPEVVLKYTVLGDDDEMALRLYDRDRAESVQAIEPEVIDHIRTVLRNREHAAAAKLREEEEARLEAEEAAAEEEEKSEAQRRLAQQKIIRIDDRLK